MSDGEPNIWRGITPDGYPLVIERDSRQGWIVTVAAASRSRNHSLEIALTEAGGASIPHGWAAALACTLSGKDRPIPPATHDRADGRLD